MTVDRSDSHYEPSEALPPAERAAQQAGYLREAVAAACADAPAMRARLDGAGLRPDRVRTLDDLAGLPVLRKDALPGLQAASPPFAGLVGVPTAALRRIYVSPGPIYDPEPPGEDYWGLAPALHAAGFRRGDVVLVTFAFHLTPAGHMMDSALGRLGCVVVPGGTGSTDVQARAAADLGASGVIGTPSFIVTLLERGRDLGLRPRLAVALVSGEVLPPSLRRRAREEFGLRMSQAYATADVGLIGYECREAAGLHLSDRVAVELLAPDTGRPVETGAAGEVVVSLLSPPYALLRFGTGDLAAWAEGPCPCGRTAPRLAGILGRVGDAVKIRGQFVHPAEADQVLRAFPEIARYQIVVTRPGISDEARLSIETAGDRHAPSLAGRIAAAVQARLRLRFDVDVVPPGTIPDGAPRILDRREWR